MKTILALLALALFAQPMAAVLTRRMSGLLLLCLLLAPFIGDPAIAETQAEPPGAARPITPEEWRGDIAFLRERLIAMHPNPFRKVTRDRFEVEAARLEASLPSLSREGAIVGIMRLVASLGDGHTTIPPFVQPRANLHVLPLRFHVFGDGIYLSAADRLYAAGIGGKLRSIGGVPANEVHRRLRTVTPGDNAMTVEGRLPSYLVVPEVLAGLGIIKDASAAVPIELDLSGRQKRLLVRPIPAPRDMHDLTIADSFSNDWADTMPPAPPLWLKRASKPYWYEYLAGSKTLYIQYNKSTSDHADPMPAFARRLRQEIENQSPDRVVLDLRLNSGGEAFWNRPLLLALIRPDSLEARGKLFVLIGRQTFSAGTLLAIDLEKYSSAIFIGEPTGGALQNTGNHDLILLPASGLAAMIATSYYQNNGPHDDRPWVAPQIAAELTQVDYQQGLDPAMAAILNYRPPAEVLKAALLAASPEGIGPAFRKFKADPSYRYLNTEPLLTGLGYEFIRAKDFDRATAVMRVAVEEHPGNANAHDSLGDAYRAAGQRDAAISSYRRALEITPGWESARRSLGELGVEVVRSNHRQ